jgi:heme-degrading monooxygenase HmoA
MIARVWRGATLESNAERYMDYMKATGVKDCRATEGNRGVMVLRRTRQGQAEFVFVSLWESLDAIRRFAGDDVERAVYYPEDKQYLLELGPKVEHWQVDIWR